MSGNGLVRQPPITVTVATCTEAASEGQMWWPLLEQGCWVSSSSYSQLSLVLFHSWLRKIVLKLIIIGLSEQINIRLFYKANSPGEHFQSRILK